jgi:hypothetical protein
METTLKNLIKLAPSTPGRRILALRKMRAEAVALDLPHIVELADKAIAHDMETRGLDMRWLAERTIRSPHAAAMPAIEALADQLLTGLRDGARLHALGADGATLVAVDSFIATVFPAGVFAVTSLPYVDEAAELERIVTMLHGPLAPQVIRFGLGRLVERLAVVSARYREALHPGAKLDFATVRAAREQGQLYLLQIVAMIMGTFPLDTPEHVDGRRRLLGSIMEQDAAIRAYRRGRRAVPDMDPDTGDIEIVPAAETLDMLTGLESRLDEGPGDAEPASA